STLNPSFFLSAPAMAPRTVCACQPNFFTISSIVAPSGFLSISMSCACLLLARVPGVLDFVWTLRFGEVLVFVLLVLAISGSFVVGTRLSRPFYDPEPRVGAGRSLVAPERQSVSVREHTIHRLLEGFRWEAQSQRRVGSLRI